MILFVNMLGFYLLKRYCSKWERKPTVLVVFMRKVRVLLMKYKLRELSICEKIWKISTC